MCGDLTSAFNFGGTAVAFPTTLPNAAALVTAANSEESLPAPTVPSSGAIPAQESGDRPAQPLGYVFNTATSTKTSTGQFSFETVNAGTLAAAFTVYTVDFGTYQASPYTCPVGGHIGASFTPASSAAGSHTTKLSATTAGRYDITVTASTGDGFARRFAGRFYA